MSITPSNTSLRSYDNPFSSPSTPGSNIVHAGRGSVADTQIATKELGEIQARVFLAKQYSRDQAAAYDRIMTACQRVGLASVAIYTYSRGGTNINGPSIRLAEEIVRDWGNIDCGWVELERSNGESTVRAYAWDLESNAYKQIIFVVPHVRSKKQNGREIQSPITNERDLYELIANSAARRMRNCILALVPGDVVEAAVNQCHETLVTTCKITPERIKNMLSAFESFGVTKAQIETRIQRKLDAIAPAQFVKLTEIYNSLKDGMSEVSDWFEVETADIPSRPSAAETLKNSLKSAPMPPRPSAPSLPSQEQSEPDAAAPSPEDDLFNRLQSKIAKAKTRAGLKSIFDSVVRAATNDELDQDQASALYEAIDSHPLSRDAA